MAGKQIITALAMLLTPPAVGADWEPISDPGSPVMMYWDVSSISPDNGEVWILIDYQEPFGPNVRSAKSLWRFDCKFRKLQQPVVIRFDGQMGDGNIIDINSIPGQMRVVPDSLVESIYAVACLDNEVLKDIIGESSRERASSNNSFKPTPLRGAA